jgi:hypothetical protein
MSENESISFALILNLNGHQGAKIAFFSGLKLVSVCNPMVD